MGVVSRFGGWLGFGPKNLVAGITLSGDHLVVAALRPDPVRLVGIARLAIGDGAVVEGDVRLPERVAGRLGELRTALHLPTGTACVVSVDPLYSNVQAGGPGAPDPTVEVGHRTFDQAGFVATSAGFRPQRVDVRPAALARVALAEYGPSAAVRSADGWSILADNGMLDGSRRSPAAVRSLQIGPDLGTTAPCTGLTSVVVPNRLRAVIDLDCDLEAVGAALLAFGHPQLVTATPASPPDAGSEWTIESIPSTGL